MGDEEGLRIRIQSQQSLQLATCEQAHCPARAERLESIFPSSFLQFPGANASIRCWSSVNILGTHLAETLNIPKMSVRIVCTALKRMLTSLAILRKSRLLSHRSPHFHQWWHLWGGQTLHHPQCSLSHA